MKHAMPIPITDGPADMAPMPTKVLVVMPLSMSAANERNTIATDVSPQMSAKASYGVADDDWSIY